MAINLISAIPSKSAWARIKDWGLTVLDHMYFSEVNF